MAHNRAGADPAVICRDCGASIEGGDRFCGDCGAAVPQSHEAPKAPERPPAAEPAEAAITAAGAGTGHDLSLLKTFLHLAAAFLIATLIVGQSTQYLWVNSEAFYNFLISLESGDFGVITSYKKFLDPAFVALLAGAGLFLSGFFAVFRAHVQTIVVLIVVFALLRSGYNALQFYYLNHFMVVTVFDGQIEDPMVLWILHSFVFAIATAAICTLSTKVIVQSGNR